MPSTDPFQSLTPTGEVDRAVQGLKVPPHSVEAEQSVIGALLLDNSSWDWVAPILRDTDFYRTEHAIIYQTIGKLVNDNKPADVLTVHEELKSTGLAENYGITYLNQLTNNTPSAANVRGYAQIISDRSILRRLIQTADGIANSAFDPEGKAVRTILDEAESRILAINQDGGRTADYFQMDSLMTEVVSRIEELQARGGGNDITGVPTGFIDLDKKTSGLQKGDLVIVAGRPSMGKAQPLDARIKTYSGWKKMQDIMVGDYLASIDGAPSFVTGVFPQGLKEIFAVEFSDGRKTQCCAEHLWRVSHSSWPCAKVLPTSEIATLLEASNGPGNYFIDPLSGDFGEELALPVEPHYLGELLAKGHWQSPSRLRMNAPSQPVADAEYASLISLGLIFAPASTTSLATTYSVHRRIPNAYLNANKAQRQALLAGFLAVLGEQMRTTPAIGLSVDSEDFAQDIALLVRSLGGLCSVQSRLAGQTVTWSLELQLPSDEVALPVAFEKIYPVRRAQAQCIAVSHSTHTYLTDDYVVTHNTSFAMNIAEHAAVKEGLPVIVFSMEMAASQLATRMLGSVGRVNQGRLRTGNLNDEEWQRFTNAIGLLSKAPMLIDETGSLSSLELRARARRMARKYGKVGLIVIDYLQLMVGKGGSSGENRTMEISEISRSLKALAKEMGCPVIALSQLNRGLEQRPNKRPIMSDLRESGAIEQDADVIIFIYRDSVYNPDTERPGVAEIIIGKQRNGEIGTVELSWQGEYTKFDNLALGYQSNPFAGGSSNSNSGNVPF